MIGLDTKINDVLKPFHKEFGPSFSKIYLSIRKNDLFYLDKANLVCNIQKGLTKMDVIAPAIAEEYKELSIDDYLNITLIFSYT